MFKYVPSTWSAPALCVFDECHILIRLNTSHNIKFINAATGGIITLRVPNPKITRLSVCETLNNIFMYVGDYYTIAFRRRTKTFELVGPGEHI